MLGNGSAGGNAAGGLIAVHGGGAPDGKQPADGVSNLVGGTPGSAPPSGSLDVIAVGREAGSVLGKPPGNRLPDDAEHVGGVNAAASLVAAAAGAALSSSISAISLAYSSSWSSAPSGLLGLSSALTKVSCGSNGSAPEVEVGRPNKLAPRFALAPPVSICCSSTSLSSRSVPLRTCPLRRCACRIDSPSSELKSISFSTSSLALSTSAWDLALMSTCVSSSSSASPTTVFRRDDPLPRTTTVAPLSPCSICCVVPRGPMMRPTKL
mmetsp:Transcript_21917/g.50401  ORF Transcript_21917/g.50401 Transcript_21917/m.50401 type:complete len:266 (+) Transcript_21917:1329-2126(+)